MKIITKPYYKGGFVAWLDGMEERQGYGRNLIEAIGDLILTLSKYSKDFEIDNRMS